MNWVLTAQVYENQKVCRLREPRSTRIREVVEEEQNHTTLTSFGSRHLITIWDTTGMQGGASVTQTGKVTEEHDLQL